METQLMTVGPEGWDRRFLELAGVFASWSKDPSTKVGCAIVGPDREVRSTGFNGFPRGVADTIERLNDRDMKYPLVCHGEENAILHAALIGVSLKGCTAYINPWPPCTRCARSLAQVGIAQIVYPNGIEIPDRWKDDFKLSMSLLQEAGVQVRAIKMHFAPFHTVQKCPRCGSSKIGGVSLVSSRCIDCDYEDTWHLFMIREEIGG
jgi:dCMP deaminase